MFFMNKYVRLSVSICDSNQFTAWLSVTLFEKKIFSLFVFNIRLELNTYRLPFCRCRWRCLWIVYPKTITKCKSLILKWINVRSMITTMAILLSLFCPMRRIVENCIIEEFRASALNSTVSVLIHGHFFIGNSAKKTLSNFVWLGLIYLCK